MGINAGAVPATVYPRWRGEHGSCEGLAISSAGLSPLARGTRVGHPQLAFPHRFIPAGAGNTAHIRTGPVNRPVYPRWRGEHQNGSASIARITGLSPLARGTRLYISKYWSCIWFIPAGAGNTIIYIKILVLYLVYPRWRGEHSKHNLLLINDFLSQSQSTNFTVSHKQHIHYVKEHLIH